MWRTIIASLSYLIWTTSFRLLVAHTPTVSFTPGHSRPTRHRWRITVSTLALARVWFPVLQFKVTVFRAEDAFASTTSVIFLFDSPHFARIHHLYCYRDFVVLKWNARLYRGLNVVARSTASMKLHKIREVFEVGVVYRDQGRTRSAEFVVYTS